MKSRLWMVGVGVCLALGGAWPVGAAEYYVDDDSDVGDVYTPGVTGSDFQNGLTPSTPKRTVNGLLAAVTLLPGDIVYIDTGTHTNNVVIGTAVTGAPLNRIEFRGTTNGTVFTGSGNLFDVRGKHLQFRNIRVAGGYVGLNMVGAAFCRFDEVQVVSNSYVSAFLQSASNSNEFRRCVFMSTAVEPFFATGSKGNYIEHCIGISPANRSAFAADAGGVTNIVGSIMLGDMAIGPDNYTPDRGSRNLFFTQRAHFGAETVADVQRIYTNWTGNAYADPKFLNAAALDFHLLSAAGFVSNGTWVVDPAVGYSPAIDFGPSTASVGDEPPPNGGRVNIGLHGGTENASKSRTDAWLFAMSYNDGGTLMQTGQLEWVASTNFGATTKVDLQYSTNRGTNWSDIARVDATNETYAWTPAFSNPAVLWRVAATNGAVASTNAKPFSIRNATNTAFNFYVNDDSAANDMYCGGALGNDANSGIASNVPKRSLQALFDAYQLRGGDRIYVDTGTYATNLSIGYFDGGSAGNPVRITGSTNGVTFNRGNTTVDALTLQAGSYLLNREISHLEIENLQLAGGLNGLYANRASNIVMRNVRFTGNQQWGVSLVNSRQVYFEGCLAANNSFGALSVPLGNLSNFWSNGTMWDNTTNLVARTNSLSVSNSILANGTTLFGDQVVPGDYNVVWGIPFVGGGYDTNTPFSTLQNAGFWARSLKANPQFANAAGGDYHLKSVTGRYDPGLGGFVADLPAEHSPAIDFGDPAASVGAEPPPHNGGRLNAGMHGGTTQASQSRTNTWLQLISYMDGGTLSAQTENWLRWTGGNYAPGATVTILLSRDGGLTWTNLASGVMATNGVYRYQEPVADNSSSFNGLLKVELESDSNVSSQSPTNFTYLNGTFSFYVNDAYSPTDDVYCTAAGDDLNPGLSRGAPMANLHAVLAKYPRMNPGDRIYVDTGVYTATNPVNLTASYSGTPAEPILIAGSTNRAAGGTVFSGGVLKFDFRTGASNIVLRDITLTNVARGVAMTNAVNVLLDGVEVRGASSRAFDLQGVNARSNQLVRCVAHGGAVGAYLLQATNVTIRNSVFYQNSDAGIFLESGAGVLLENSLLSSTRTNAVLISFASATGFSSDYNGLHAGPFTRVGRNRTTGGVADNLAAWQVLSGGRDVHSVPGDPQMADPGQYDYHLKTQQTLGRRLPDGGRISDLVSSPLLDAGNPATTAYANEPAPNGGRINIGRFGGTAEASIALDSPWLKTVSFGDAGSVTSGVVPLVWTAGGGFSNQTVNVEVSSDGGKTWGSVTSGVPATNGIANWILSDLLPDTPAGVWRVVCLSPALSAQSSNFFFSIRKQPLDIFVATADTNEAVYVAGPGAADNWRATSNEPINSVRTVFERFDLEPGDRIWVDPGTYAETEAIMIGMKNSGSATNPVQITGNVLSPYRGTVLARVFRTVGSSVFQISRAGGVRMEAVVVSNGWSGVSAENTGKITLERVRVGHCGTNAVFAGAGATLDLNRVIIGQNQANGLQTFTGSVVTVQHSLIQDNARANVFFRGGALTLKNSILEAAGSSRFVYYLGGSGTLDANYNNIRATEGANVAGGDNRAASRFLIDWQISSSNDVRSSGYAANFANAAAMDFHLQSASGRYVPATGGWTNDATTARLIDLGDPAASYANEPTNNGGRVNVGLYGNTGEASKSSGQGMLVPLTMSDGGTIRGAVDLHWSWEGDPGIAPGESLVVQFSGDGGSNWVDIANAFAGDSKVSWDSTNVQSTAMGVWRVATTNGTVWGQTETLFAVRNVPLSYYVNDGNPDGDVYCSEVGRSTNSGLETNAPIDSVARLLGKYKVEPGDVVYVDTGIYRQSAPLVISVSSPGATNRLIIQGSTNEAFGGSVFTNASGAVIELQNTHVVELRDLRLHGGDQGLLLTQASSNLAFRVRSVGARGNAFQLSTQSDQNQFIQCAALNFSRTGFSVVRPPTEQIAPATNHWIGGVLSPVPATSNGTAVSTGVLVGVQSGRLYVSNSVFVANSPAHGIYSVAPSVIRGNYNCYHQPFTNTLFALIEGAIPLYGLNSISLAHLGAWAAANLSDGDSFSADPLFGDLENGDLHPRSAGGRYRPETGTFEPDGETSPLIDAADPAMPFALEQPPNGGRANLGIYGNDPQASWASPTHASYVLLTLNEGGTVQGTQTLKWLPQGEATSTVGSLIIQLSTNSGLSFPTTLATVPATQRQYEWNSTLHPSVPTARWRVQHSIYPEWVAASDRDFLIHNTNLTYYVDDASTNNNAYCSMPGNPANTGLSPDSPLPSLADVLARYDLEPGDVVKVDTGTYTPAAPITIGYLDCGTAAQPVTIQGSTNPPGTVFSWNGLRIENARGVAVKNLKFESASISPAAASVERSEDITLEQVDVSGAFGTGLAVAFSSNVFLRNFSVVGAVTNGVASQASYNTRLEFGTIWSNGLAQVSIRNQAAVGGYMAEREASFVTVSNCILGAFGVRNPAYEVRGTLHANYNNLYLSGGALAALAYEAGFAREFDSVGSWSGATNKDTRSLSHDPRFADAVSGDFHLKSSRGRFDPATGTFVEVDPPSENSPLIDAGDPDATAIVTNEPSPNGGRVNLGRYGGTPQASKTPTNGALTLISFNDGGRASGTNALVTWLARGSATGSTVTISYSADGGLTWTVLTNGISSSLGSWTWNTTNSQESVEGKLKIEASIPGVTDAISDKLFSVRNGNFSFYVNDRDRANDVYCGEMGSDLNSGLSSNAPMETLGKLLDRYDLESGDIVYIDTGVYKGDPWRITQADSAGAINLPPVVFQGSTYSLLNGTVLDRELSPVGIQVDYAVGVQLRNITVSNTRAGSAVSFNECHNAAAEHVVAGGGNIGFSITRGSQIRVANCLVFDAFQGVLVSAGLYDPSINYPVIENNVFWETAGPAIQLAGGQATTVRNNILSVGAGHYVYDLGETASVIADHNAIWLASGGRVYRKEQSRAISPVPIIYETVGSWAAAYGQDLHSYDGDPLLVDPAGRNFHLKSQAGRHVGGLVWTNDPVSSPLIDAGWTNSAAWANEPTNNGGRINIGLHGGTPWASKTSTNSALHLLTLNRGGVASGLVALNWKASGMSTGHTVRLDVSLDDDGSWTPIATNLQASLGGIQWNSAGSSPLARWRVRDEQQTNVFAISELSFVLHNGPIHYYVNDEFHDANDIYCDAPGSSGNTGVSPDSPKRWISEILDAYNLEPGDVIYVDTGNYQAAEPTVIGDLDAGDVSQDPSRQVTIMGSTNVPAGGSRFTMSDPTVSAFKLQSTHGIRLNRLNIQSAWHGLSIQDSYFVTAEWMNIRGSENGAHILSSSNIVFSRSALAGNRNAGIYFSGGNKSSLDVGSSVVWSNRYGIYLDQGYARASNSIFGMLLPNSFGFYVQTDKALTEMQGDYNSLYVQHASGAVGGWQTGAGASTRTSVFTTVSAWTLASGQDAHSLAHPPHLADPGTGDYHLKSKGGRHLPGETNLVYDDVSSPLIDAGNPQSMAWTAEPDPNGRRLNIGLYGGTAEASRSPTGGWITLITLNDGGTSQGSIELKWAVGGAATNYTVCIYYSPNEGITWTNVICGVSAGLGSYLWDSVPYGRSALGLWRIKCQQDESIDVQSQSPFILRNFGEIPYYVNDVYDTNDVYCTASGDNANHGLSPAKPKASLQAIFDTYELAPEDVVYVDGGTYWAGAPPIEINQRDSGYGNVYVTIQGSTNPVAPTVFQSPSLDAACVFSLNYAVNVRLKDLTIRGAKVGVESYQTIGCQLDSVRVEENKIAGLNLNKSATFRLIRSVLRENGFIGVEGVAVALSEASLAIENSVLWNSPSAISGRGVLTVTNSVLDANGPNGRIYRFGIGGLGDFRGDYNCYSRKDGALIAEEDKLVGGNEYYNDLPLWSAASSSDWHSMTIPSASVSNAFANAPGGDFHLRSPQGRFWNGAWTNDAVLSPLIDAGAPEWPSDQEPVPNGGRINIGAYGNTPQASMTQTNPPWVRAVSLNEGGVVSTNVLLYWAYGGIPDSTLVRLEYSDNYMDSWKPIASNRTVGSRQFDWDISSMPLSLAVFWRVVAQASTNVWDACDLPFSIKTRNYDYYVNDGSTNGDRWCTQVGQEWNPGTNSAAPISSVNALLARYPVGGGDRIYIDTGEYPVTSVSRILLNNANTGTEAKPLLIYGSTNASWNGTNALWNGTLLAGDGSADGIKIQNARYIEMHNLRIKGMGNGVSLENVDGVRLRGLELFNNLTNGIFVSGSGALDVQNCRIWRNGLFGYYSAGQKGRQGILNSTFWANQAGAALNGQGLLNVSNSILVVTNGAAIYTESGAGAIGGDYNLFSKSAGGVMASNLRDRVIFSNLRQWQTQGRDQYSLVEDPLFVDPASGNFHLQSRQGYWSNGTWAVSANTSWAIDAGDPSSSAATNELPLNSGGRINLGAYGGTSEASLTDTNSPALLPVSLRDGGVAPNNQILYWLYRGLNPTNTVNIQFYDGASWQTVAENVRIDTNQYVWSSSVGTPEALWRVVLVANPAILGATDVLFSLRPFALTYFVNDDSRDNDVYTGAFGSPTNRGYVSNSPLHSIQAVLEKYQLLGGDEIKVDTGVYAMSEPVQITLLSRGDTTNRVKFTGSTNWLAGGSRLEPEIGMNGPAFLFYNTSDIDLSWFHVLGFTNAVSFQGDGSIRCRLMDLDIQGSFGAGVALSKADDIELLRVLIREGETNGIVAANSTFGLDGCVLWSNRYSTMRFGEFVELEMTNSVLEASGVGNYCYLSSTTAVIKADYNNLYIRNGAQVASINGLQYEKVPAWSLSVTQDVHSLSTDPLFHDPSNGDFHLQSKGGRYDPATRNFVTTDTVYSRLIDMGSPRSAWSNEPSTNGSRRNIGLYGNTAQASKSNTNRWLQAVTAMGGGIMYGMFDLVWGYGGGIASNEVVQLWYSYDNGTANWRFIDECAVGAGQLRWQSDELQLSGGNWILAYPTSPAGRWRIVLKNSSPAVMDMIPTYFGLRNSPFTYYLNDTSRVNDVYTDAVGDNTNMGFYAAAPKLTLKALLEEVDLEPTDRIFVDTGIYQLSEPNLPWMTDTNTPIRWEASDGGEPPDGEGNSRSVVFQGSTHPDGSHFVTTNKFPAGAFFFMEASHVDMRDLWFAGESMQFTGTGLVGSNLFLTNGSMWVASDMSVFENIQVDRGSFTLSGQGNQVKLLRQRWGEAAIVGTNVTMMNSVVYTTNQMRTGVVVNAEGAVISNCTLVSSAGSALGKRGSGTLRLGHSILVAGGADPSSVIAWEDGGLISDWNNLQAKGASTWVGTRNGRWERLSYWQAASGQDANSVSFEPGFQSQLTGDFHLNSLGGRWSLSLNDWDYGDTVHSPLIDLGDPGIPAGEPAPSGGRRNLGAFGGTSQASKSRPGFWLTALTQNDGGVLKGTNVTLRWRAGNADGKYVTLSYFDGTTWTDIATVLATDESFVWNTTGFPDSFNARWRVVAEDGSSAAHTNNLAFPLRNHATNFYVNDANGEGDIYCSATGSVANTGLATNSPRLTLQSILDDYDLEGGDRVYVDTGVYPSPSNIRIIWSRSGETNNDVVIQGNTNHAYGTRLTRSGSAGYPAVGFDVKASQIQLAHMAIQGVDRGILLESNRNTTVRGVVVRDATTAGIAVEGAQNTLIRNSGFWNGGWGVSLNNTSTSTLENLSFVDFGWAGIRLANTRADAMQNNIFVPATNAYAYSVGAATSLLMNATMDYNLYDFSRTGSGFYEGWTNIFRKWQLSMNRDFRSALTNARLADIDGNNDFQFHPLSTNGRWTASGWTMADTNTSWAVDHGNPNHDYSQEPTNHGDRLNIGMYGNTVQASQGSTVTNYEIRTLNNGENIFQDDSTWPMIWSTHLVDSNEWVQVMFSNGQTNEFGELVWITLATLPAYQEYYVFAAESQYQTVKGRWQVIGVNDPSLWAANAANFNIRWGLLRILSSPQPVSGLMRFNWAGGVGGLRYRIEYSDDYGKTWNAWEAKYNGPAPINLNNFTIQAGQASPSYTFEDRTSYLRRSRWYRIWELPQ
ncbi:MAG: hypothetical protein EOM72_03315 [Opitutae bacterium]|nr:hypothetical protein [Opitutae bacterium]